MAYDTSLAERIRGYLAGRDGLSEQKMFGGIGFMLHGNLCCGVMQESLLVRVRADEHDQAAAQRGAEPMRMGGRTSRGFVVVAPIAIASQPDLAAWIERGIATAEALPPK